MAYYNAITKCYIITDYRITAKNASMGDENPFSNSGIFISTSGWTRKAPALLMHLYVHRLFMSCNWGIYIIKNIDIGTSGNISLQIFMITKHRISANLGIISSWSSSIKPTISHLGSCALSYARVWWYLQSLRRKWEVFHCHKKSIFFTIVKI